MNNPHFTKIKKYSFIHSYFSHSKKVSCCDVTKGVSTAPGLARGSALFLFSSLFEPAKHRFKQEEAPKPPHFAEGFKQRAKKTKQRSVPLSGGIEESFMDDSLCVDEMTKKSSHVY